jgi:hypothetical protein
MNGKHWAIVTAVAAMVAGAAPAGGETIETLEKFRASFEQRMNTELDEHGQKARTLREGYLQALTDLKTELGRQENLKAAAQVVAEIETIEEGDDAALPEDADHRLEQLRKTWEEGLEKILKERNEKTATTAKLYLKALDDEKLKHTRAGQIKDALLFEEEEKRVRALPEVVAALQTPEDPDDSAGDLALASRGARVTGANDGHFLIDGRTPVLQRSSFAWAKIPCRIEVSLPQVYEMERIRLLLWNGDKRTYRYRLAVSEDGANWKVVKDSSGTDSSGWQEVDLRSQPVQHIRIFGLANSANDHFHVVELEAYQATR